MGDEENLGKAAIRKKKDQVHGLPPPGESCDWTETPGSDTSAIQHWPKSHEHAEMRNFLTRAFLWARFVMSTPPS